MTNHPQSAANQSSHSQTTTNQSTSLLTQPPIWHILLAGSLKGGLKNVFLPVVVSVFVALTTTTFMGQIQVSDSAAHSFLDSYYSKVVQPGDRSYLFNTELTENFRNFPGHGWDSYEQFWATQQSVTVESVIPVEGTSSEFTVVLAYEKKGTNTFTSSTVNVWLQCHGNVLTGRVPGFGCTPSHLEIDNTQLVPTGN